MLTPQQSIRYSRNTKLEGFGKIGQERLLNSSVLVIGTGALGSIVSMYLAASGVGRIGIVDFDTIDISNLQRQLSFAEEDCGKSKVHTTADKLKSINSEITIEVYDTFLRKDEAHSLISKYDFVVECTDNPNTKYMVTDACTSLNVPYCFGGVAQYAGQVFTWKEGSASYRDIFPEPAEDGDFMPCAIGGVLGPLPGIVGSIQASEVIKYLTGIGTLLTDRILTIDALTMQFRTLHL